MAAIGVDGCKAGWFYFRFAESALTFGVVESFADLMKDVVADDCILVDIPIGLLERGRRERACDVAARAALSPKRGASVFSAPARQALRARSYEEALAKNKRALGRGLSRQTWGIVPKVREVDELLAKSETARHVVRETHPEICFWGLLGGPMEHTKKTRDGFLERLNILKLIEPAAEQMIAAAFLTHGGYEAARDDIVDAFVAALCARSASELMTLPQEPELDRRGLRMEIAYLPGHVALRAARAHAAG